MLGYLNYIRVSDGQHSVIIDDASEITIKHATGRVTKVLVGAFETQHAISTSNIFVLGHETKQGNRLIERQHYGKEYRTPAVMIPYSANTWQSRNGTIKRNIAGKGVLHEAKKVKD